jgi:hypothetical protein
MGDAAGRLRGNENTRILMKLENRPWPQRQVPAQVAGPQVICELGHWQGHGDLPSLPNVAAA